MSTPLPRTVDQKSVNYKHLSYLAGKEEETVKDAGIQGLLTWNRETKALLQGASTHADVTRLFNLIETTEKVILENVPQKIAYLEKAIAHYKGELHPSDANDPNVVNRRERNIRKCDERMQEIQNAASEMPGLAKQLAVWKRFVDLEAVVNQGGFAQEFKELGNVVTQAQILMEKCPLNEEKITDEALVRAYSNLSKARELLKGELPFAKALTVISSVETGAPLAHAVDENKARMKRVAENVHELYEKVRSAKRDSDGFLTAHFRNAAKDRYHYNKTGSRLGITQRWVSLPGAKPVEWSDPSDFLGAVQKYEESQVVPLAIEPLPAAVKPK